MATNPLQSVTAYLKAKGLHLLYFIPLLVLGLLFYHFIVHRATIATSKAQQADTVLQQQKTVNTQQAVTVERTELAYQALAAGVKQQNTHLADSTASAVKQAATQQVADTALPLGSLSTRLQADAGVASTEVTVVPAGLDLTPAAALAVVQKMDSIPALLTEAANARAIAANDEKQIAAQDVVSGALKQQVLGLNAQITDGQKACATKVSALKANERRSKLRWLGAGVVIGIALTVGAVAH